MISRVVLSMLMVDTPYSGIFQLCLPKSSHIFLYLLPSEMVHGAIPSIPLKPINTGMVLKIENHLNVVIIATI